MILVTASHGSLLLLVVATGAGLPLPEERVVLGGGLLVQRALAIAALGLLGYLAARRLRRRRAPG